MFEKDNPYDRLLDSYCNRYLLSNYLNKNLINNYYMKAMGTL